MDCFIVGVTEQESFNHSGGFMGLYYTTEEKFAENFIRRKNDILHEANLQWGAMISKMDRSVSNFSAEVTKRNADNQKKIDNFYSKLGDKLELDKDKCELIFGNRPDVSSFEFIYFKVNELPTK